MITPLLRCRIAVSAFALLASSLVTPAIGAQGTPSPRTRALATWMAFDATPGEERTAVLARSLEEWRADAQGNLIRLVGTGRPLRVIACGIDHPAYVVSEITDDGYLRVHRAGTSPLHPLFDQSHQAQQVFVRTARGVVPGVVAIPNGHFSRQHRGDTLVVNVDQLWVDVGARSRAEVVAMGIALIDPVQRDVPPWEYGDYIAGTDASGRAGCAAVAAAGAQAAAPASGATAFVISTGRSFAWNGLAAALNRMGGADQVTIVGPMTPGTNAAEAVVRHRTARPTGLATVEGLDSVTTLTVRARWAGSQVESVRGDDADALRRAVVAAAGGDAEQTPWVPIDSARGGAGVIPRGDSLATLANMLARFSDLPGVPSHEYRVRAAVHDALPAWASRRATVDSAGNIFVAVGPARDTMVIVAHMDEVSYVVSGIRRDGTVTLDARGGVLNSAWEGQPALLHFDADSNNEYNASLPGVFVPRDSAVLRTPRAVTAWFGLDSTALVARGVRLGSGVTAYKRAERIGAMRFTGRALDDRAGTVALLRAIQSIEPSKLDHTVIFAWATYEEGGLLGSRALARQLGTNAHHVYAVDTFVSSDTPLELPTFAYAPLGNGPVLRALDDGAIASRVERERIIRAAKTAGVRLQIGTTHGATDASSFSPWGGAGAGLSWPGRYSHSPGEVLDLRDVGALARLITAVASAPTK